MLCGLLAAWLWEDACPRVEPSFLEVYEEAAILRPEVSKSIALANDVLAGAGHDVILVPNWSGQHLESPDAKMITVYLVRSPASRDMLKNRANRVFEALEAIWKDDSGLTIDEALDGCTELDDCVEELYPNASLDLILEVLNTVNASELGKTALECSCLILIEEDLQIMQQVFGANWDGYVLSLRYETITELEDALANDKIAPALLDDVGLPLAALTAFILLHEVGHHFPVDPVPVNQTEQELFGSLNLAKLNELSADTFVAEALLARCSTLPRPELLEPLCLTPATLSMLTFVVGLKAKSKTARCIRFFDPSITHPNWQLRLTLMGTRFDPESERARNLFEGYLADRNGLLALDWPYNTPGCDQPLRHTIAAP